jgi:hypothetical protein
MTAMNSVVKMAFQTLRRARFDSILLPEGKFPVALADNRKKIQIAAGSPIKNKVVSFVVIVSMINISSGRIDGLLAKCFGQLKSDAIVMPCRPYFCPLSRRFSSKKRLYDIP